MDIGKRLKSARESLGYRLEDLSEKTGIGLSAISEYENGRREPKVSQISKLAMALKKPLEFFLTDEIYLPEIMLWRDCPEEPARKLEVEADFEQLCRQYHNLEIWTSEKKHSKLPFENGIEAQDYSYNKAKALAAKVQKELNLGDIPSAALKKILEERYIKIFYLDFAGSAISNVSEIYGPAILLNRNNKPWRRSFDLAHEFFHILTWPIFRKNEQESCLISAEEKFADCFASSLLLPENALRSRIDTLSENKTSISFNGLENIAREFDVSFEALLWRIKSLYGTDKDVISRAIVDSKRILGQRKKEELVQLEVFPKRYIDLAQRALREGGISLLQFCKYTRLTYKKAESYLMEGESKDEEVSISVA